MEFSRLQLQFTHELRKLLALAFSGKSGMWFMFAAHVD